ncbi:MAG: TPM domain-containing protein [Zymomonas mobilis subsp. pomaceae]|uniref:TPM domain-containing protein n=1 Tax=Zymomonas mobilis TaxID=542 RepID=UPI0039E9440D
MSNFKKNLLSRCWLLGCLFCAFATVFMTAGAFAQNFPDIGDQYVVDAAHVLSPQREKKINAELAEIERKSGHQMIVVTVDDLQGYDIRDYGYRLGRHWGIGHNKINDGLLFIVYPKAGNRKVSVEVGYGLEGSITDALTFTLLHQKVVPVLKKNVEDGIEAGVQVFGDLLTDPEDELRNKSLKAEADYKTKTTNNSLPVKPLKPIHPLIWIIIIGGGFFFITALISESKFQNFAKGHDKNDYSSKKEGFLSSPISGRLHFFFGTLWSVLRFILNIISTFMLLSMLFGRRNGGGHGGSGGGFFGGDGRDNSDHDSGNDDSFGGGDGGSFGGGGASDDW